MAHSSIVLPGQLLNPSAEANPGSGVHVYNSSLYASIAGPIQISSPKSTKSNTSPTYSIPRHGTGAASSILPEVDAIVLARVTRLNLRQVTVEILVVNDQVCREAFQGIIRREDIRATEKDKIIVADSFRVGDIVRGTVVSNSSHKTGVARQQILTFQSLHDRFRLVTSRITISLRHRTNSGL
jgi:exosome complex component CSL4